MNRQFQNRLVGTIVLVALGVIFLPDLLDGKKIEIVEEFTEIPLRQVALTHVDSQAELATNEPEAFQQLTIAEPLELASDVVALGEAEPVKEVKKEVKQAVVKETVKVSPPPVRNPVKKVEPQVVNKPKETIKAGFTLQLGGFNSAANVSALVAQLRKAGYTAYTLPTRPIEGKLTRVFVGPEVSDAKLKARQDPIFKLTGLKGKILAYNPQEQ